MKPEEVFDDAFAVFHDVVKRVVWPTVMPPEGCILQTAKYISSILGAEYKSDVPTAHSFVPMPRTYTNKSFFARQEALQLPNQSISFWGSSIIRSFSLYGHCCAFFDKHAIDNWRYVAVHKVALQRTADSIKMATRVKKAFSCVKRAVRLKLMSASRVTWFSDAQDLASHKEQQLLTRDERDNFGDVLIASSSFLPSLLATQYGRSSRKSSSTSTLPHHTQPTTMEWEAKKPLFHLGYEKTSCLHCTISAHVTPCCGCAEPSTWSCNDDVPHCAQCQHSGSSSSSLAPRVP